jgi:DNA-binding transcriptional LysR family regulator
MSDRLLSLRVFARVARLRSFSLAGRELRLSQPSVSRIISALEDEVGAALLTRTTRGVSLTEAGSDYLVRVETILLALEEADHAARGTGELRGVLRLALPTSFGVREVVPRLPGFLDHHPALRVELEMSDRLQDLVAEGIDVALRFGALADSTAVARRVAGVQRMLVAAPAYLSRAGRPGSPNELSAHSIIFGPPGASADAWTFTRDGRSVTMRLVPRVRASVNEGATLAAVGGLGIMSTTDWGCRAELADGRLVRVLPDWQMGGSEINAVFPAGQAAKPSARALIEYMVKSLNAVSQPRRTSARATGGRDTPRRR